MFAQPQAEHHWLDQLIGNWSFEHNCQMPDGSTTSTPGKMDCRSLGGLWLVSESSGQSAEGDEWSSVMTLGFDPAKNQYVGTFVASMMANIWQYQASLMRREIGCRLNPKVRNSMAAAPAHIGTQLNSSTETTGCLPASCRQTTATGSSSSAAYTPVPESSSSQL